MKYAMLIVAVILSGCATSIKPVQFIGPNGKTSYSMRCSGFGRNMQQCYQVVGELCPAGYNIIENSASTVAVGSYANINGSFVAAPRRELAVECK